MPIIKAEKTLQLFEKTLRDDQGAKYRGELRIAMDQADDPFRSEPEDDFRSHLGGSTIGGDCPRALWYTFRWVTLSRHIGRIIRLFNRGHLEEARFVALIRASGLQMHQIDTDGKQFRVKGHGGHFGSAIDGVVIGVPDIGPNVPVLTEMKTSNDKNFQKLKKEGVRESKFVHFVQMQIYMKYWRLKFALYICVNKNDDELWAEIIPFEPEVAEKYWERAGRIVFAEKPPKKINENSTFFICKMCDFREVCHKGHQPERNCRTCRFSKPMDDGSWLCRHDNMSLDKKAQLEGCGNWSMLEM